MLNSSIQRKKLGAPWLIFFAAGCPLLLCAAFARIGSDEGRQLLLGQVLYWSCPLIVAVLLGVVWVLGRNQSRGDHRVNWGALALSALLAILVFQEVAPTNRVEWDESNLYSASLSMRFSHSKNFPVMALPSDSGPSTLFRALDKRPPMFPYLVALLHLTRGISLDNPFLVNEFVLFALLLLVFFEAYRRGGWWLGVSAQFLLLSSPLLLWVATSGGMDLLACFSVIALLAAFRIAWEPLNRLRLLLVISVGLFASYVRYEVVLIVLPLLVALSWRYWKQGALDQGLRWCLALLPTALLPLILLLQFASHNFAVPEGKALLSFASFRENAVPLGLAFFWRAGPFRASLNLVALFTLVLLRKNLRSPHWVMAASLVVPTMISLAWFAGSPTDPVSARLYLLPATIFSLIPIWLAVRFSLARYVLFSGAATLFFFGLIVIRKEPVLPITKAAIFVNELDAILREPQVFGHKPLWVSEQPFILLSRGVAAVNPFYFLDHWSSLCRMRALAQIGPIFWVSEGISDGVPGMAEAKDRMAKELPWRDIAGRNSPVPIRVRQLGEIQTCKVN